MPESARTAKRILFGISGSIAGTVYGTIVVMAVIAAGSRGDDSAARVERLGSVETVVSVALNALLGLVIVAIEVALAH